MWKYSPRSFRFSLSNHFLKSCIDLFPVIKSMRYLSPDVQLPEISLSQTLLNTLTYWCLLTVCCVGVYNDGDKTGGPTDLATRAVDGGDIRGVHLGGCCRILRSSTASMRYSLCGERTLISEVSTKGFYRSVWGCHRSGSSRWSGSPVPALAGEVAIRLLGTGHQLEPDMPVEMSSHRVIVHLVS